jgi:hypothetical protein
MAEDNGLHVMVAGLRGNIKGNRFATTEMAESICSELYRSALKMPIEDIMIEGFVEPTKL